MSRPLDAPPENSAPAPQARPSWRYLAWRALFTKHNELDLGYAFLVPFLWLFFLAWVRAARGEWQVTSPMWGALCTIITSMLVATVPVYRARILRDRDYGMSTFDVTDATAFSTPPAADAR